MIPARPARFKRHRSGPPEVLKLSPRDLLRIQIEHVREILPGRPMSPQQSSRSARTLFRAVDGAGNSSKFISNGVRGNA